LLKSLFVSNNFSWYFRVKFFLEIGYYFGNCFIILNILLMEYFYFFNFRFYLKINLFLYAVVKVEFLTLFSKSSFFQIMIILHVFKLIHHLLWKYTGLFYLLFEIQSTLILFIQIFKDCQTLRLLNMLTVCYYCRKWYNHFFL